MRTEQRWLVTIAAVAGVQVLAGPARAQTFPADGDYTPLRCGGDVMTDRLGDEPGAVDERDLVGNADAAAGYRAVDADFLYLRVRLDADAIPGGTIRPFAWGFELDVDGDRTDYEILGLVDGVTGNVLLYENTVTTSSNDPTDPADTPAVATYALATHARSTTAGGSSFGDDTDFFLSFALPWADLQPLGLEPETPVRVWAASSSSANSLNGDFACHDGASGDPGLGDADSDPAVLDPDVDSDGDGVSDDDEVAGGSDPNDPSSRPGDRALAGGGGCSVAAQAPGGTGALVLVGFVLVALAAHRPRSRRRRS